MCQEIPTASRGLRGLGFEACRFGWFRALGLGFGFGDSLRLQGLGFWGSGEGQECRIRASSFGLELFQHALGRLVMFKQSKF